jgi:hypothetical protein
MGPLGQVVCAREALTQKQLNYLSLIPENFGDEIVLRPLGP